jgi:hypothetical protein
MKVHLLLFVLPPSTLFLPPPSLPPLLPSYFCSSVDVSLIELS